MPAWCVGQGSRESGFEMLGGGGGQGEELHVHVHVSSNSKPRL